MAASPIMSQPRTAPTITGASFSLAQAFVDLTKEAAKQSGRIGLIQMSRGTAAAQTVADRVVADWMRQGFDTGVLKQSLTDLVNVSEGRATKIGADLLLKGLDLLGAQ